MRIPFVGASATAHSTNANAERSVDLKGIAWVIGALSRKVRGLCFLNCGVRTAVCAPVDLESRHPSRLLAVYPKDTTLALPPRGTKVLQVNRAWYIPQIGNGIVRSIAVNVIDVVCWPSSGYVEPCQSVAPIHVPVKVNLKITQRVKPASGRADWNATVVTNWTDEPRKTAGIRVVLQKLTQTLRGKIGLSHDALQMLIGQKPVCVCAHDGLHYFIWWAK